MFGLSATVDADKFVAARDAMLAEVEKMKAAPVSADELSKAVKQFISATLSARKTMQGQAQDLGGSWLAANDLNFSERYLAAVKRVTPADLQRVAREYLTPENRTLYALLPTGATPKPAVEGETSREHPVQKFELANGLRLLVKEDHRLPFVEFRAVFQGGVLAETAGQQRPHPVDRQDAAERAPTRRSAEDIAREIESVGGSIDSYGGNNSFGVNAEVLSSDFATGLDLLADVLLNPTFPAPALERERQVQLAGIRAQKDHLLQSASLAMRRALFGERGYGLDALGTEASVQSIQVADLRAFHQRLAAPEQLRPGHLRRRQNRRSQSRRGEGLRRLETAPRTPTLDFGLRTLDSIKRVTETRDKKQAVLVIGFRGTTVHDADRYPLELLQEACSDLGSRLFLRIREKLGLAYYVGAQNVARPRARILRLLRRHRRRRRPAWWKRNC